jgi:hypothetical protein
MQKRPLPLGSSTAMSPLPAELSGPGVAARMLPGTGVR